MAKFPELSTIGFASPVRQIINFKTLKSTFDDLGEEQRKQKWLYPKRDLEIQYPFIDKADIETLWQFYIARGGAYGAFAFFLPEPEEDYPTYTGEYVGTGDGSTETFNLPGKTTSGRTVYLAGAEQTDGSDYNFTALGGTDGEDQIDFSDSAMTPPAEGSRITIDFTGILKVRCRFAEDNMSFDLFWDRVANTGLKFKGLLNE